MGERFESGRSRASAPFFFRKKKRRSAKSKIGFHPRALFDWARVRAFKKQKRGRAGYTRAKKKGVAPSIF